MILLFNCQWDLVLDLAKFHPALGGIRVVPNAVKIIGYNQLHPRFKDINYTVL